MLWMPLLVLALVFAGIDEVRSDGQGLTSWAVIIVTVYLIALAWG